MLTVGNKYGYYGPPIVPVLPQPPGGGGAQYSQHPDTTALYCMQTNKYTDLLMTVLRNHPGGKVNITRQPTFL